MYKRMRVLQAEDRQRSPGGEPGVLGLSRQGSWTPGREVEHRGGDGERDLTGQTQE